MPEQSRTLRDLFGDAGTRGEPNTGPFNPRREDQVTAVLDDLIFMDNDSTFEESDDDNDPIPPPNQLHTEQLRAAIRRGSQAVRAARGGPSVPPTLSDLNLLLTGLMHWAEDRGIEWKSELRIATAQYTNQRAGRW